jgi:hypothetical protein
MGQVEQTAVTVMISQLLFLMMKNRVMCNMIPWLASPGKDLKHQPHTLSHHGIGGSDGFLANLGA